MVSSDRAVRRILSGLDERPSSSQERSVPNAPRFHPDLWANVACACPHGTGCCGPVERFPALELFGFQREGDEAPMLSGRFVRAAAPPRVHRWHATRRCQPPAHGTIEWIHHEIPPNSDLQCRGDSGGSIRCLSARTRIGRKPKRTRQSVPVVYPVHRKGLRAQKFTIGHGPA